MEHKAQLKNKKYRNWVRAGLGTKYVKEGLEWFCEHLVRQQHTNILDKVKQKHSLSTVSCGVCDIRTLQPDHVRTRDRRCPLGQANCNCQHPSGKTTCPNNVCSAIYDEIIQLHASTPQAPCWRNSDAKQWCDEPWAIAKCFINAPGYEKKIKADDIDCPGLLHILINNIEFQQHIKCVITGTDVFSKVLKSRNSMFHSPSMELDDSEVNTYIDDMIELLEDEKEIKHEQEAQDAVKKLSELKQEDFIITTTDEDEVRRVAMDVIHKKEKELQQNITDATIKLGDKATESIHQFEEKGSAIKSELGLKETEVKKEIEKQLEQKLEESKLELDRKEKDIQEKIELKFLSQSLLEHRRTTDSKKEAENTKEDSRKNGSVPSEEQHEVTRKKAEYQKKLVGVYTQYVSKISALPLQPEQNHMDISEVYVPAWLTEDIKDSENTKNSKDRRISVHDLFSNDTNYAKFIYVVGEAGSGKSMFCKYLVHCWCLAHSVHESNLKEQGSVVTNMKIFEFLFYVSLRHCSDLESIEIMLEKLYHDPILGHILHNESEKCLIVLDGLDEWTPHTQHHSPFVTPGLPGRNLVADYTIITTSRQWKFDVLRLKDSEVDKKIKLKGIDKSSIEDMTEKTVKTLNAIFHKDKEARNCTSALFKSHVSDIIHIPLILQQLICLWFDDKLGGTSKYAVYTSMLALFFEWNALKTSENRDGEYDYPSGMTVLPQPDYLSGMTALPLPNYLNEFEIFRQNTNLIQYMSYLAFKTLKKRKTENTLTFSSSSLTEMNIPRNVIKYCLKLGIVIENETITLHASMRRRSSYSFFHKSMQEYLAAVYIAIHVEEMTKSGELFPGCETAVDILKQSNVLIMLCGLEPRLLTQVSEYIYNVASVDKMIIEDRNRFLNPIGFFSQSLISDIQTCVLKCIDESMSGEEESRQQVYIADIHVSCSADLHKYTRYIIWQKVLSIEFNLYELEKHENEAFYLEHFTKCDRLKTIKYRSSERDDKHEMKFADIVAQIIVTNRSSLETISLLDTDIIMPLLILIVPEMRQLISLGLSSDIFPPEIRHDVCWALDTVVNQSKTLKRISLHLRCESYDTHTIDLSKHSQLQYINFTGSSFSTTRFNAANLETCKLNIKSCAMMKQVCNTIYKARNLKHLELDVSLFYNLWPKDDEAATIATESLIRLLPSLKRLRSLTLRDLGLGNFTFTDNIITCPTDMKCLEKIKLKCLTMSMKTWCSFIDSLPKLPQTVRVVIFGMIISDGKNIELIKHNETQTAVAQQYVIEKTELFQVTKKYIYDFKFTTKKV